MKRRHGLCVCIVMWTCLVGLRAASSQTVDVLRNADIMTLVKSGLDADVIMLKIDTSTCQFDTSTDALAVLKVAGVPDGVIRAMVRANAAVPRQADQQNTQLRNDSLPRGLLRGVHVRTEALTPDLRQRYMIPDRKTNGTIVVVSDVWDGAVGIRQGDVIWGLVNADGGVGVATNDEFTRAAALCSTECLVSVFHPDGNGKNGFVAFGTMQSSFEALSKPGTGTVAYRSLRSGFVVALSATPKDEAKWFFDQAFGDSKRPKPGVLGLVAVNGDWNWVTAGGAKAPVLRLAQ